jgi:hypothetical protein
MKRGWYLKILTCLGKKHNITWQDMAWESIESLGVFVASYFLFFSHQGPVLYFCASVLKVFFG